MSSELDWVVEFEEPPLEDSPVPQPPSPSRRRPPGRLWLVLGLGAILLVFLILLWRLGGREDPLPNPDPSIASLEAAVQLEINSLLNGDEEIYAQMQDASSARENPQPNPDAWFGEDRSAAGPIEPVDMLLIDEQSARAEILLTWKGKPYRLHWFYRLDNDRWLHTDWLELDLGAARQITSPHLTVVYRQAEEEQAQVLLQHTERFIAELCTLLSCRMPSSAIRLEFDPNLPRYYAERISAADNNDPDLRLHYRIPSPLRVRWPWNNQPEALVLGSIGRHLVYDLFVSHAETYLDPENRTGLTLASIWLSHYLMGLETPPVTRWLDEATLLDGLPAATAFVRLLAQDVPPDRALALAFGPETLEAITILPDYFGWLLVLDPAGTFRQNPGYPGSYLPRWPNRILGRFDENLFPWETNEIAFQNLVPETVSVRYQNGWAITTLSGDQYLGVRYYFRLANGAWRASNPDETLLGEKKTYVDGPFSFTYYAIDEPFIPALSQSMRKSYQQVTANLGIDFPSVIPVAIHPPSQFDLPEMEGDIYVYSPSFDREEELGFPEPNVQLVMGLIVVGLDVDQIPEERVLLLIGTFLWQLEQLGYGIDQTASELWEISEPQVWQFPDDIDDPAWMPLEQLWTFSDDTLRGPDATATLHYSAALIGCLVDQYGVARLRPILDSLTTVESLPEWIESATGQSMAEFETAWRQWILAH